MLPSLKRVAAPLLALLLTAPLPAQEPNRNVRFGPPGPARPEPSSREAYLIARPQYVLSYNAEKRIPNWAGRGQCPGGGAGRLPDGAGRPVPPSPVLGGATHFRFALALVAPRPPGRTPSQGCHAEMRR